MPSKDDEQRQFGEYFTARHDSVRRTAYLLCGDWHWADDLTQVAFTKLAAGWHRVRDPQALDAYVRTCLARAYFAELRRVWRRRERSTAELPEPPVSDDDAEAAHRRLIFTSALSQLPPRQRAVLVYRYYQGLDVAATAEALGCSEGTVKSQTARGLDRLRAILGHPDLETPPDTAGVQREPDRRGTANPAQMRAAIATEVQP
jgi:RNA polymerase sigma-70 factor (sigma-E family)